MKQQLQKIKQKLHLLFVFLMLISATATAQSRKTVTGTVTDNKGEALAGVSVLEKGTGNGVTTNGDGKYSINVTDGSTLRFSFIGFVAKEVPVGSQTFINASLEADSKTLDDVVITGLGIKREKKTLGYAQTTIKSEQLETTGSAMNAMTALYGKVPGMSLTTTALGPSGGINLKIRNSIALTDQSNTRPLFVIDGIPMLDWESDINRGTGNGLNDIDMDNVESFEVLKGSKAAVLYGGRGANGVILITTKSGAKRPGLGIDANFQYASDNVWVQQEFQNQYGSGLHALYAAAGVVDKDGFYTKGGVQAFYPTPYNFGPKLDGRNIRWYDDVQRPYIAQPDNIEQLYRNGVTAKTNVAIQGGGSYGSYRLSYNRRDYKGIFQGFDATDNNFQFNGNVQITDRVNLKLVSTFSNAFNHNSPTPNQNAFVTYGMPRNLDMELLKTQVIDPETGYGYWRMNNRINTISPGSIVRADMAEGYFFNQWQNMYDNTRQHFTNSATLNIKFSDKVSLETVGGFDLITNKNEVGERLVQPLNIAAGGNYSLSNRRDMAYHGQSILRYDTKFKNYSISALAGAVIQRNENESMFRRINGGFITRDWFSLNNSRNNQLFDGSGRGFDNLYGVLGSVQVGYKEWLFVDVQGRNDWSSILPPGNNSFFYPGVSAIFVFSDALKMPSWLDFGKLRASWADTGRPGPRYFANTTYGIGSYGSTITYSPPSDKPAVDLKPERKREYEFGLEAKMLENRLGFEFSFYTGSIYNQILGLSVAPSSGVNNIRVNAGEVSHQGIDLLLTGTPLKTKDFAWNMTLNAARNQPKVKKLAEGINTQILSGVQGSQVVARVGRPFGELEIYPYAKDANGNRLVNGTGNYYQDKSKRIVAGKVIPDMVGGLLNQFNYKNFTLNFNLDYSFGSTIASITNLYMIGNGSSKKTLEGRDEASGGLPYYVNNAGRTVRLPNHNSPTPADSRYPFIFHDGNILPGVKADGTANDIIITATDRYAYYWQSFLDLHEEYVYKNDYIKLRDINLMYTIPQSVSRKFGIDKLKVSIFANNIAYLYKTMPNVDAESVNTTNSYYENNAWPTARTFGASLRASF